MSTLQSAPGSIPCLSREDALIDLRRISEHDEAKVAHVLLRDALHLSRGDSVQLVQKLQRVAPAAAEQFVLGQLCCLGRIRLLTEIIRGEKLCDGCLDIVL